MVEDFAKIKKELEKKKTKPKSKKSIKLQPQGKLLKKPSLKGIKKLNATKVVMETARYSQPLVREVEERPIERDDRSLFFKEEYKKERKIGGWI